MIGNQNKQQHLSQLFPLLENSTPEFRERFFSGATLIQIPADHTIAPEDSVCGQLALVVSGKIRVYKLADSGREITLYRINSGDSCVLTASCIMSDTRFPAIATTESEVEALIIRSHDAREWMSEFKPWNAFIFSLISKRLVEVIAVLEEVAFHRMDERIATYLIAIASHGPTVNITHHQIAADLGTTREVVSRILKVFEGRGLVEGARGKLTINNLPGLKTFRQ